MKRSALSREQATTPQVLLRLRVAAGINQTTLAARLGITQSEVSKFERGERALDERRLQAWLDALQVEWTSFVCAAETSDLGQQAPRCSA
jgi:transcriptional regulator with XRE-family HTH domain